MGVFAGVARVVGGILAAFRDYKVPSAAPWGLAWLIPALLLVCVSSSLTFSFPMWVSDQPNALAWANWGVACAGLLPPLLALLPESLFSDSLQRLRPQLIAITISVLNAALLAIWITREVEEPPATLAAEFVSAGTLMAIVPGLLNVLRLAGEEVAIVVAITDVVAGFIAGGFEITGQFV
jgi:hypothetical protein